MVGFDERRKTLSGWETSLAGAVAGAVTRGLCQPFDVVKIRFQLQVEPLSRHSTSSKYTNVAQAVRVICREEGLRGLWKGHLSGQLLSITYGVFQFQVFEVTTKAIETNFQTKSKSLNVHTLCGALAGVAATVASFPFDVIRTRFIAQGNQKMYVSLINGFSQMMRSEGVLSMYKGLAPTLIAVGPQTGAIFAFHNIFSSLYKKIRPKLSEELDLIGNLAVGSLAGTCGKTVVYPLDLARKRLQLQGFQGRRGFGENFTCRNLLTCLVNTVRQEGALALYKGLSPSLIKAALTTALHFTAYEETCKILAKRKNI